MKDQSFSLQKVVNVVLTLWLSLVPELFTCAMSTSDSADELRLPQTVISRLVKDALPQGIIVSKEARTAIARAAAVFILHASTYAQDCAVSNKRKTVTANDVLSSMRTLECDDLIEPIKEAVEEWKSNKQQKLDEAKKRKAERERLANEASEANNADVPVVPLEETSSVESASVPDSIENIDTNDESEPDAPQAMEEDTAQTNGDLSTPNDLSEDGPN